MEHKELVEKVEKVANLTTKTALEMARGALKRDVSPVEAMEFVKTLGRIADAERSIRERFKEGGMLMVERDFEKRSVTVRASNTGDLSEGLVFRESIDDFPSPKLMTQLALLLG